MTTLNSTNGCVTPRPSPNAHYWKSRAEELEQSLNAMRRFLLHLAQTLPAEYVPLLAFEGAGLSSLDAPELTVAGETEPDDIDELP